MIGSECPHPKVSSSYKLKEVDDSIVLKKRKINSMLLNVFGGLNSEPLTISIFYLSQSHQHKRLCGCAGGEVGVTSGY